MRMPLACAMSQSDSSQEATSKRLLEFAASQVLRLTDANLFIKDEAMDPVVFSADPVVRIKKTGGTTKHRQQGGNYISYALEIPSVNRRGYSMYVTRASTNPAVNQQALARAIRWFITHYHNATTFTRDETVTTSDDEAES